MRATWIVCLALFSLLATHAARGQGPVPTWSIAGVKDPERSDATSAVMLGDFIYLTSSFGLYRTHLVPGTIERVTDLPQFASDARLGFDGEILFVAEHPALGLRVWRSDGTREGTRPIPGCTTTSFVFLDARVLCLETVDQEHAALLSVDRDGAVTRLFERMMPWNVQLLVWRDHVIVVAQDVTLRTDGTVAGTAVVDGVSKWSVQVSDDKILAVTSQGLWMLQPDLSIRVVPPPERVDLLDARLFGDGFAATLQPYGEPHQHLVVLARDGSIVRELGVLGSGAHFLSSITDPLLIFDTEYNSPYGTFVEVTADGQRRVHFPNVPAFAGAITKAAGRWMINARLDGPQSDLGLYALDFTTDRSERVATTSAGPMPISNDLAIVNDVGGLRVVARDGVTELGLLQRPFSRYGSSPLVAGDRIYYQRVGELGLEEVNATTFEQKIAVVGYTQVFGALRDDLYFIRGPASKLHRVTSSGMESFEDGPIFYLSFRSGPLLFLFAGTQMWWTDGRHIEKNERFAQAWSIRCGEGAMFWDGVSMWRTDGPTETTRVFAPFSESVASARCLGERFLYVDANTHELRAVSPGGRIETLPEIGHQPDYIWYLPDVDGQIFWESNHDLYVTNGARDGTRKVFTFDSWIGEMAAFRHRLYFSAVDREHGREMWTSDGTQAGTRLVADLYPGPGSSNAGTLTVIDDRLLFSAYTDETGREIFISNGTHAGTHLLYDAIPGPTGSDPAFFVKAGGRVIFDGVDLQEGRKLWSFEWANVPRDPELPSIADEDPEEAPAIAEAKTVSMHAEANAAHCACSSTERRAHTRPLAAILMIACVLIVCARKNT